MKKRGFLALALVMTTAGVASAFALGSQEPAARDLSVPVVARQPAAISVASVPEPVATGEKCDVCGEGEMMKRWSKNGWFLGCANYPKCKNTAEVPAKLMEDLGLNNANAEAPVKPMLEDE